MDRKPRKRIALTVNGKKVERDIPSRMTLAEFLREELDLTGTKVGCNRGECGSCTVILDGDPVLSCTVLGVEASGREVLTIEGLAPEGRLHPIQEAFIEHDALQCGYCTPGMIMSVKALLDRNPNPTKRIFGNRSTATFVGAVLIRTSSKQRWTPPGRYIHR